MDTGSLEKLYAEHIAELGRRYAPVLADAGFDALAIHSGSLAKRTEFDDQYWPLRPTPHFQHWLPLAQPDCVLILRPGCRPQLAWLKTKSFWEKPSPPQRDSFLRLLDVAEIADTADVKGLLPAGARVGFVGEAREAAAAWGLPSSAINPPRLVGSLDRLRATKTAYEVTCIAEANRLAAAGHEAVAKAFRAGEASELQLHLLYLSTTGQDDPETPYKNIVALGPHAATLHHVSYSKRAASTDAQSLLLDAGATFEGYCSDITRTWVKGGTAEASSFLGLVEGVERMQQRLCAQIKLGEPYEELHDDAHRQVGAILREVGLTKISAEEAVSSGVTRAFFPHGLGHSLGLQCHDVGCALVKPKQNNPYLRNTSTIVTGQVFTVEPGIYFIDSLLAELRTSPKGAGVDWNVVDALAKLGGVRIEDDIVVGEGASVTRNLTREVLPVGGGA